MRNEKQTKKGEKERGRREGKGKEREEKRKEREGQRMEEKGSKGKGRERKGRGREGKGKGKWNEARKEDEQHASLLTSFGILRLIHEVQLERQILVELIDQPLQMEFREKLCA